MDFFQVSDAAWTPGKGKPLFSQKSATPGAKFSGLTELRAGKAGPIDFSIAASKFVHCKTSKIPF
jgi:hypothetical protein